jgi:DNA polymerase III epsilon subunit-like protein
MVQIMFFDTETTGLPRDKKISAIDSDRNWPDLVSICWSLYEDTRHIRTEYHIIRPQGWKIPNESVKIHGITEKDANRDGVPLTDVLSLFQHDLQKSYLIVAHNLVFDKNVVCHAYKWRLGIDPLTFWPSEDSEFCTAQESKDDLKLPSKYPRPGDMWKIPSLNELYFHTFKENAPEGDHNAVRDVDVLQKVFWKRWNIIS